MYLFSLRGTSFTSNLTGKHQSWLTSTWSKRQFSFVICLIQWRAQRWTWPSGWCSNTTAMNFSVKNIHSHPYWAANQCCWIKEIGALLVTARVGTQTIWKQMEVSRCCQGLWLHFDTWRGCRSLNSGWNSTKGEVTIISYLWIGAPGPKGEKGMPGASEEGSQGPRGRTGRVTTTSVCWSSKAMWWSPALRFKASSSWRTSVVGLDSFSHHSPVGSIIDGSSLLKCKRLLQAVLPSGAHSQGMMDFEDLRHVQRVLVLLPLCMQDQMLRG